MISLNLLPKRLAQSADVYSASFRCERWSVHSNLFSWVAGRALKFGQRVGFHGIHRQRTTQGRRRMPSSYRSSTSVRPKKCHSVWRRRYIGTLDFHALADIQRQKRRAATSIGPLRARCGVGPTAAVVFFDACSYGNLLRWDRMRRGSACSAKIAQRIICT